MDGCIVADEWGIVARCSLVVRMTLDFGNGMGLPLAGGGIMPTESVLRVQNET